MNSLIVYFLPSILGIKVYSILNKEKNKFELFVNYLLHVLFSNIICMLVLMLLKHDVLNLFEYIESNYIFSIKYMSLTIFINLILAFIFTILTKYFYLSVEVKHEEKHNKKIRTKGN